MLPDSLTRLFDDHWGLGFIYHAHHLQDHSLLRGCTSSRFCPPEMGMPLHALRAGQPMFDDDCYVGWYNYIDMSETNANMFGTYI